MSAGIGWVRVREGTRVAGGLGGSFENFQKFSETSRPLIAGNQPDTLLRTVFSSAVEWCNANKQRQCHTQYKGARGSADSSINISVTIGLNTPSATVAIVIPVAALMSISLLRA